MSQDNQHTKELIRLCKKGNQKAQLHVYNMYYKAMYNTALRIIKDTAEAEDIMQESFLSAFTKLDTYKGEVTFGAWLKRIVVNNSIYQYRKQSKHQTQTIDDILYKVEDNADYEFTNVKAQKVLEVIKTLKDNYRIALTLFLIEGYDYEEIGEIMDMNYNNCRTTISRAKESLRKKLMTICA